MLYHASYVTVSTCTHVPGHRQTHFASPIDDPVWHKVGFGEEFVSVSVHAGERGRDPEHGPESPFPIRS